MGKRTEYNRKYRENNRERIRVYQREWSRKNKRNEASRRYSAKKQECKKKNILFEINIKSFIDWWKDLNNNKCYYCNNTLKEGRYTQIDRKDPLKGYTLNNIVKSCFMCNRLKSNIFTEQEWLEIVKRYNLKERY